MNSKHPYERNIRLISGIRVCFSMLFVIPVINLYWNRFGMDLVDIFWLHAIFAFSIVLLEIPTGYIGDKIGRKKTLILACGIAGISWILYALADSFLLFVLVEILLGMAFSFLSGTDTALLYESLEAIDKHHKYTSLSGHQLSLSLWTEGGAAIVGALMLPLLAHEGLLIASALVCFAGLVMALGIKEPKRDAYSHPRGTLYGLYKIARFVFLRSTMVKRVIPLMAACSLATMLGVWLYQPLWINRGIPKWTFGILWALFAVIAGFSGRMAPKLEKKLGDKILLLLPVPVLIGYTTGALLPGIWGIVFLYMVPILRGLTHPILSRYIHEETFSDKRATVLSIQSWLFRLMYAVTAPIIGTVGKEQGPNAALIISAIITLLVTIPFCISLYRSKQRNKTLCKLNVKPIKK